MLMGVRFPRVSLFAFRRHQARHLTLPVTVREATELETDGPAGGF